MRVLRRTGVIAYLFLASGCISGPSDNFHVQMHVVNRSEGDILSVVIDADVVQNSFGFLGTKGAGKTALACRFRFAKDLAIEWKESGKVKRVSVDVMPYAKKRDDIKSFTFGYLGGGRWDVVAQSGTKEDSPVVSH